MGEITGDGTAVDTLGGPAGYGETALPRGDEGYVAIDVTAVFENGIVIGDEVYLANEVFVSTDGFITFGTGASTMPDDPASLTMPFIAPFLADIDTRIDGEGAESGQIWLDIDTEADCITITWEDVGFYRRNATDTNTFQVQLYDVGDGAMDVVFRYESIEWTSGDLEGGTDGTGGSPALIGYRMDSSGNVSYIGPSGDEAGLLTLPTTPGNTGVEGLYIFRLGGAPVPIAGTAGADVIFGTGGSDTILGMAGDDRLMGSAGGDIMDGGSGNDIVDYSGAGSAVGVDLRQPTQNTGWAEEDVLISIEVLIGSGYDDFLFGSAGVDTLDGGSGNDSLDGRAGNDVLIGGGGADQLNGKNDDDRLDGGEGSDWLIGDAGSDLLLGGEGNDNLIAHSGNDTLYGGEGSDTLDALNGDDLLDGEAGNDVLYGRANNDSLYGGEGDDTLYGNPGEDTLWGGAGNDTLTGGSDRDIFAHSGLAGDGTDLVTDYCLHHSDTLEFGQPGASAGQFSVTFSQRGGGTAKDATITYLPTGQVIWILEDVGNITDIFVQSGSSSFTIL